ncbi:TonB-dependent receptor, partial [Niveispirillum sp.]|uniref:TonB-dependent receptor n=1 Tax=Niveispirillum sp. TaxID=1917217 RepID=UPI001B670613
PSAVTTLPARDVIDARLSIDPTDSVRLELFVTNLFDETYIASQLQNSSSADGGIIYGARRQYGGRLTYRF